MRKLRLRKVKHLVQNHTSSCFLAETRLELRWPHVWIFFRKGKEISVGKLRPRGRNEPTFLVFVTAWSKVNDFNRDLALLVQHYILLERRRKTWSSLVMLPQALYLPKCLPSSRTPFKIWPPLSRLPYTISKSHCSPLLWLPTWLWSVPLGLED